MLARRSLVAGVLTLAAFTTTTPATGAPTGPAPVSGGSDVPNGAHPYVAGLRHVGSTRFFCTGTLIRRDWVLTAAHCASTRADRDYLEVRLGQHDLDVTAPLAETHRIRRIVLHPGWRGRPSDTDLALLHLSTPSAITPARLGRPKSVADGISRCRRPHYKPLEKVNRCVATAVRVFGWGHTSETETKTRRLQTATGPLFSRQRFGQFWVAKVGACLGDSGGPMLAEEGGRDHRLTLIGVASFVARSSGPWCGGEGTDQYSDVTTGSSLHTWIQTHMQAPTSGNPPQGPACNPTKPNCDDPA